VFSCDGAQDRLGRAPISGEVGGWRGYPGGKSLRISQIMPDSTIEIDATDRRLLREVQRDGRAPVVALAERVGLSATPCQRRLRRLEEAGVIAGYAAVLDAARLGLGLTAFVQVSLASRSEETVEAFHAAIGRMPEVLAAWAMSGETDYLLQVLARDLADYGEFATRRLLRLPGVKDTRSAFVLRTVKPPAGVPV
jgi:Lrp/AsnC family leucine-responsive transcriptional regulator